MAYDPDSLAVVLALTGGNFVSDDGVAATRRLPAWAAELFGGHWEGVCLLCPPPPTNHASRSVAPAASRWILQSLREVLHFLIAHDHP
ncbi:hypothetical protein JOD57_000037 [Geodermatophilus bullaregiensis]|nr:hypothetical protein [Geodermatophilus bullaregiensis]